MGDDTRTRRDFIRSSAVAGGTLLAAGLRAPAVHAAGSDEIRIGLVGCGGRGSGAAADAVKSSPGVRVVAIGDAFADRVGETRERLQGAAATAGDVPGRARLRRPRRLREGDRHAASTTSSWRRRPASGRLTSRPPSRAGKHVFTEKPVAVDGPGIRTVLAAYEEAKKKNLGIVAGTQRRHQTATSRRCKRIHDGAIGDDRRRRAATGTRASLWNKPRQASWTDLEWQIRNWLYFTWLSRRPHRRAARPQPRRHQLGARAATRSSAVGMGGRQVAHRARSTATSSTTSPSTTSTPTASTC